MSARKGRAAFEAELQDTANEVLSIVWTLGAEEARAQFVDTSERQAKIMEEFWPALDALLDAVGNFVDLDSGA